MFQIFTLRGLSRFDLQLFDFLGFSFGDLLATTRALVAGESQRRQQGQET